IEERLALGERAKQVAPDGAAEEMEEELHDWTRGRGRAILLARSPAGELRMGVLGAAPDRTAGRARRHHTA
ncbi:MAG: hypothetical protein AAFP22_08230, partial [Planctomycetota bacterium]